MTGLIFNLAFAFNRFLLEFRTSDRNIINRAKPGFKQETKGGGGTPTISNSGTCSAVGKVLCAPGLLPQQPVIRIASRCGFPASCSAIFTKQQPLTSSANLFFFNKTLIKCYLRDVSCLFYLPFVI